MDNELIKRDHRISNYQKNSNRKQWYKDQADKLIADHNTFARASVGDNNISDYTRMKVNYDLFNNRLNLRDFEYVCQPFGAEQGELPAQMTNKDIVSGKIKSILGMEMKRPFSWKPLAVNRDATTQREQEHYKRIKDYAISQVMTPIRQEIEAKLSQQTQGRELSKEEIQQLNQQIEQELKASTPEEVKKYMEREYQDPSEVMSTQLLNYLTEKENLKYKFNECFKHGLLSAKQIMYVGIQRDEPVAWIVNPMRFNCEKSPDNFFIEDSEWATQEYRMSISDVIKYFGGELTNSEIDDLYETYGEHSQEENIDLFMEFYYNEDYIEDTHNTIKVMHCVWKSLRRIGILSYIDMDGLPQETVVDESYKLNIEAGDISIDWEWLPEVYETWKIGTDKYVRMRPVPGQFKDIDNLYYCKLPYYGVIYDNMNSSETSLMDRLKSYQYYFNIVMYRLELMLASDKGKKVMMNINAIPDSAGIDIEKWQYFFESTPFMWFDPNEEGTGYQDVNTMAKSIDLSLASDIAKYIDLAEYIRTQAGRSVGITDAVEGQIGPREAVSNTQQNLIQSSHILEPYFEVQNQFKRNVLQGLIETAKVAYTIGEPRKLSFILDGISNAFFTVDQELLDNCTIGIFVTNSAKAEEAKDLIRQLTHAAMQNQKVELSDVINVIRQDSVVEAEESLKVAENNRREYEQQMQNSQIQAQSEEAQRQRDFEREKHEMEKELIILKEEERRKTEIAKASLMGASFNPDQDADNNGINDFVELANKQLDGQLKVDKQNLDREKFEHQKDFDNKKLELEKKKINKQNTAKK